jgi:hypothetical protein
MSWRVRSFRISAHSESGTGESACSADLKLANGSLSFVTMPRAYHTGFLKWFKERARAIRYSQAHPKGDIAMVKHWMGTVVAVAIGLGLAGASARADQDPDWRLAPFATDGCSSFPGGDPFDPVRWQHCCVAHDRAYWAGGTYDDRWNADVALKECVAETGADWVADLMFEGVRVGGSPYLPTPFRWGYGWPWIIGYRELEPSELDQVRSLEPLDLGAVPVVGSW